MDTRSSVGIISIHGVKVTESIDIDDHDHWYYIIKHERVFSFPQPSSGHHDIKICHGVNDCRIYLSSVVVL